jgi:hypothetical protein
MHWHAVFLSALMVLSAVAVPGVGATDRPVDDGPGTDSLVRTGAAADLPGGQAAGGGVAIRDATGDASTPGGNATGAGDGADPRDAADGDANGTRTVAVADASGPETAVATAAAHVDGYSSDRLSAPRLLRSPSAVAGLAEAVPTVTGPRRLGAGPEKGDVRVRLYTYHAERGVVLNWTVTVHEGTVVDRVARAAAVGVDRPRPVEGFVPPEGAVVVHDDFRAASAHDANISVSRTYVRVDDSRGTRVEVDTSPVTISLVDFGAGDESVRLNITVVGTTRTIPSESGSQPVVTTDADGNGSVQWTPADDPYSGRVCIEATSPSASETWCHDDPDPSDDGYHKDDAKGMLTVEEAHTHYYGFADPAQNVDVSMNYRYVYTDQNLDRANAPGVLAAVENGTAKAFRDQMTWGFNDHVGRNFDDDGTVQVNLNDGSFRFHNVGTNAIATSSGDSVINYNTRGRGRRGGAALHADTLMAHEHFHLVQYSYARAGWRATGGGPLHWGDDWDWYMEGMASFVQAEADPNVTHERSVSWGTRGKSVVDRYVDDPDRPLRNHSYDYALFWMHVYNRTKDAGTVSHPSDRFDTLERFMEELQTEGGNASRDGPEAISKSLRNTSSYGSYREMFREFNVDVYRASIAGQDEVWTTVHENSTYPYNRTVLDWGEHLDRATTVRDRRVNVDQDAYEARVNRWGVDYVELNTWQAARAFRTNRTDLSTQLVLATENDTAVRGPFTDDTGRGVVGPNTTAVDVDNQSVGAIVSPLGGTQNKSYNVTVFDPTPVRPVVTEPGERAVYVVGINADDPRGPGTTPYLGDLYVGAYAETGDRNLSVDLQLADGSAPPSPVRSLDAPDGADPPASIESVADVDPTARSVWRVTVEQGRARTAASRRTIPELFTNYYTERNYEPVGVYGMPTTLSVADVPDRQVGDHDNPNTASFVVEIENGDDAYQYAPFPAPTPDHFRITVGGQPVRPGSVAVTELKQHRYRVTFVPPTRVTAGDSRVCVAFEDTKFGVTEVTDSNCGESVTYTPGDPGDGSSITIDTSIVTVIGDSGFDVVDLVDLHLQTAMADDDVAVVSAGAETADTAVEAQPAGDAENRAEMGDAVAEAFGAVDPPDGETRVAAGLRRSLDQLEATETPMRATLLVSDGRVADPEELDDVVDAYAEAGVAVHTVAVGEDADRDRLASIARRTGGSFRTATSGAELRRAMDAFDREFGDDSGAHLAARRTGDEGRLEGRVAVDGSGRETVLRVGLGPSAAVDATVRLFRPDGSLVERDDSVRGTADPSVTYARAGRTAVYRLSDPRAGTWRYEVVDAGEGVAVRARAATESTTVLDATANGSAVESGTPQRLGAALVGAEGALDDAEVVATVSAPSGSTERVRLEEQSGGGYAATLEAGEPGRYVADVRADRGGDLERVERLAWTVTPAGPTPTVAAGNASVGVGGTARVPVRLVSAPTGLRAFSVEVCLRGSVAEPAAVEAGAVGSVERLPADERCVAFRGVDLGGAVSPGDGPVTLGTVVYDRTVPGEAAVEVAVEDLVDDDGAALSTRPRAGTLAVDVDETTEVAVVLDGAPHGLSRYNLTVAGDPPIVDVRGEAVTGEGFAVRTGGPGTRTVTLSGTDYEDRVGETDRTVTLATVEYAGDVDVDALDLSVHELLDDSGRHTHDPSAIDSESGDYVGDPIDPERLDLRPAGASPFTGPVAGGVGVPGDPDGDGLYEDVDGDGEAAFRDAVALAFVDGESLTSDQRAAFDFEGDGDLDFADAVELAFQV